MKTQVGTPKETGLKTTPYFVQIGQVSMFVCYSLTVRKPVRGLGCFLKRRSQGFMLTRGYHRDTHQNRPLHNRHTTSTTPFPTTRQRAALLISFSMDRILWWVLQCKRPEGTILRVWTTRKIWQTVLGIRNFASTRCEDCPV